MKVILARSAIIASALLLGLIVFSAKPSLAETLLSQFQTQKQESGETQTEPSGALGKLESESALTASATSNRTLTDSVRPLAPATSYVATAYSLRGRTASGMMVSRGLIAADPRVLPLGSRVRLEVPGYHGEYLVADTGGMIKGKRIDIWIPSSREAMRFGRRTVKLTVLSYPAKKTRKIAKA
jgi:3D (Asp-Asp-Asp) domain-containing protein